MVRDWSILTGRGHYKTVGGDVKFYHYKKLVGGKRFSHTEGGGEGTTCFGVVFMR